MSSMRGRPTARALAERGEPLDGEEALVQRASCEPTWKCTPATSIPSPRASAITASARSGGEPELRLVVRGLDRLVRDRLDARRQPDEHASHAGRGRRAGSSGASSTTVAPASAAAAQLLVRLVVAVEEDALAGDARRLREGELAERRDVGADALVGEHPQQRDVRERLRPVDDERVRRGVAVRARLRADRLLAVDDERRPVLGRELGRGDAAERELAVRRSGGIGEKLEHRLLASKSR